MKAKAVGFSFGRSHVHYVVEGRVFFSLQHAASYAREHGFVGCDETIRYRLIHGVSTLAKLTSAPRNHAAAGTAGRRAKATASRIECAAALQCIDERKATMKGE
jgi:hypothetical protein